MIIKWSVQQRKPLQKVFHFTDVSVVINTNILTLLQRRQNEEQKFTNCHLVRGFYPTFLWGEH